MSQLSDLSPPMHLPPPSTVEPSVCSGLVTPPTPWRSETRCSSEAAVVLVPPEDSDAPQAVVVAVSEASSIESPSPGVTGTAVAREGDASPEGRVSLAASEDDSLQSRPAEGQRRGLGQGQPSLASASSDTTDISSYGTPTTTKLPPPTIIENADKESDVDVDVGSMLAHQGFYFGASLPEDTQGTDYFEQVRTLTQQAASRVVDYDENEVAGEEAAEGEVVDDAVEYETVKYETAEEAVEEDAAEEWEVAEAVSVNPQDQVDTTAPQDAVENQEQESGAEASAEVLPDDGTPELTEIARASTALTAASSSVPDSDSMPLFEDDEDAVVETVEGAGDDALVGCDMDLKHVAGGLFDPALRPAPVLPPRDMLVKGGSLPANASDAAGRSRMAAFSSFAGFKVRRSKAPRTTATSPSSEDGGSSVDSTARAKAAPTRKLSIDLKVADVKTEPGGPGAPSSHRILSEVIQGIKHAILPRRAGSGRRTIVKARRSSHRLHRHGSDTSLEEAVLDQVLDQQDGAEVIDVMQVPLPPDDDGSASGTPEVADKSPKSSRIPSRESNALVGVKKNHVEPSGSLDMDGAAPSVPAAAKESDTHSRTSAIAPPRTNFLTDDVLQSLARSSSIKYIDATLRSNMRSVRKTPERFRNVPPTIRKSESGASGTSTPARPANSPRPSLSKRSYNVRKRLKTSETVICREGSVAPVDVEGLKDHKEGSKYFVYTVNDSNVTELCMSEMFVVQEEPTAVPAQLPGATAKGTAQKKAGKVKKLVSRKVKKAGGASTTTVRSRDSTTIRRQQSSLVDKIIHKKKKSASPVFRPKRGSPSAEKLAKSKRPKEGSADTTSTVSLKKKKAEMLKRLQQFSPSDCVVEILGSKQAADDSKTIAKLDSNRKMDSCTGDSSVSSVKLSAAPPELAKAVAKVQSRQGRVAVALPRYRPTLRTPRISCVGMSAGNEGPPWKDAVLDARVVGRGRAPLRHVAKVSHASFPLNKDSRTPSSSRSRTPISGRHIAFPGLHEMAEMLCEYSTLTAAAPFASELVSLFEAPNKHSLPSVEGYSHAGICSARPSIDEVLEKIDRVVPDTEATHEGLREVSEASVDFPDEVEPTNPAAPSSFKICNTETEAKVDAALKEILNSITDLGCADVQKAPIESGVAALPEPVAEPTTLSEPPPPSPPPQKDKKAPHLHGLTYRPPARPSTFDLIETLLVSSEPLKDRKGQELEDTLLRFGRDVKVNTWTAVPTPTETVSGGVQVKTSTASAECQRTGASSPIAETDKLFVRRSATPPREAVPARQIHCNDLALEGFDLADYPIDRIPRSQHDLLRAARSGGRTPVKTPVRTPVRTPSSHHEPPKGPPSAFQRAQTRIASFIKDDIPASYLAMLDEVLPLFLERTKSELSTARQNALQHLFFEDYFNHPESSAQGPGCSPRDDPKTRWLVATMAQQVSFLVEDAARSAELELASSLLRPP